MTNPNPFPLTYIGPADPLFRLMMGNAVTSFEFLVDESVWTIERLHTAPFELAKWPR